MQVYCIISDERAYRVKSTAIFSAVLERMGIKGAYVPFKVAPDQLGQALQSLRILNIAGANITVPYKEAVTAFKRHLVRRALADTGGNQTKAAEILGLRRSYLNRLIHGLEKGEDAEE